MKFDDVGLVVSFSLAQSFSLSTLLGKVKRSVSQCPHSRILIEGGGGGRRSDRGSYFTPKKSQLQNYFVYPNMPHEQ